LSPLVNKNVKMSIRKRAPRVNIGHVYVLPTLHKIIQEEESFLHLRSVFHCKILFPF